MSAFLTTLDGEWIDDVRFVLNHSLVYQSDIFKKYQLESPKIFKKFDGIVECPAGFVTDFASVPRLPLIYSLFGDRAHHESVPHDFGYQTHFVPKSIMDSIFLEAMTVRGKPWYIRYPMYAGVVIGGESSYNSGPARFKLLNLNQGKNK